MKEVSKKILPNYFEDVKKGIKTFEVRKDEDDIQVGDILMLEEWKDGDIFTSGYTGRCIRKKVKYVLRNIPQYGLQEGYCIIGLEEHNNGWIPYVTGCDMPNEASRVWLSFTTPIASFVKSAWYINGHFEWDNCRRVKETPMAWKPFEIPAPYQPKGE